MNTDFVTKRPITQKKLALFSNVS